MLYIEIQLGGQARVYEMSDAPLLRKLAIEAQAACLPLPMTMAQAHDYLRAGCFQFEMFETVEHAQHWANDYQGFRADEVRAEIGRYRSRRAAVLADIEFTAA